MPAIGNSVLEVNTKRPKMSTLDSSESEESISPKGFGRMETISRLNRTDDSLTLLFQRRRFEADENPIGPRTPRQRRVVEDEETQKIIDCVTRLNAKIRKIQLKKEARQGKGNRKKSSESRSLSRSTKRRLLEKKKVDSEQTDSDDTDTSVMPARVRLIHPEPCDHRGVPLSHPLAITPYPGASSAADRAKARLMLKRIALKMREEQDAKERVEREKSSKRSKSSSSSSSSSSKTSKSSKSSKSSQSSSKKSKKTNHCSSCGSCLKCVKKCVEKHEMITNEERVKFFRGINKLRKKLIKPERSRENPAKSPYDVTQSSSEATIHDWSEEKQKKKKKKKKQQKK